MTMVDVLDGLKSDEGFAFRLIRYLIVVFGAIGLFFFASLPFTWRQQAMQLSRSW
jgi:hypothetical protein